jgi:sigma-B regulation protein RsbU (phosphoserine phosphatase)
MMMPVRYFMKLSFAVKIIVVISLLSVSLSSIAVYFFYSNAHHIVLTQTKNQLLYLAQAGTFLFDEADRQRIEHFAQKIHVASQPIDIKTLQTLAEGEVSAALSVEKQQYYGQSADYLYLVQKLRQLRASSSRYLQNFRELPLSPPIYKQYPAAIHYAYLFVPLSDGHIVQFLAEANQFAETSKEDPPFAFYHPLKTDISAFTLPFKNGLSHTTPNFATDNWGTFLTAVAPIKNAQGEVIAALGIDMNVSSEANHLNKLFNLSILIIIVSFLTSILAAYWLAHWLVQPVAALSVAAERMLQRDFTVQAQVRSGDELELLANVFNKMVAEVREYSQNLELKVIQRTEELEIAHEEVRALNEFLQEENLRMSTELNISRQLQRMVLPTADELNKIEHLDIACFMEPANEVGGDYYDIFQYGNAVKIGIGDVTGHGLASGVLMLMVQTAVRTLFANEICQPEQCLNILNRAIYDNVQRMQSDRNLSLALLDYQNGTLKLTGQHEEVLVVRKNGEVKCIDTDELGFPIGLEQDIEPFIGQFEIQLSGGDGIVLYTDGITEAADMNNHLYGKQRLCQIISKHWHQSAMQIQQAVIQDVKFHIGKQRVYDDITLLILKQK